MVFKTFVNYIWEGSSALWKWITSGNGGEVAKIIAVSKTDFNRLAGFAFLGSVMVVGCFYVIRLYDTFSRKYLQLTDRMLDKNGSLSTKLFGFFSLIIFVYASYMFMFNSNINLSLKYVWAAAALYVFHDKPEAIKQLNTNN